MKRRTTGENDVRNQPAYPPAEAARYLRLPAATLRSWLVGRPYPRSDGEGRFHPLLSPATRSPLVLSFWNLIEAHVIRSLRTEHGVSIPDLRAALRYAERELGIQRVLLSKELLTTAGNLFLEHYGELINLSQSGQIAMRRVFQDHLKRVEWDERAFPVRLYPFLTTDDRAERPVAIDPTLAFGRPTLARSAISTSAIAERIDAGERPADVASDYGIALEEVEQAVLYERAA